MKLSQVTTPSSLEGDAYTSRDLLHFFRNEINSNDQWTDSCTNALQKCPSVLFQYDRLCYAVGNCFGDHTIKIVINPYMVHCYHPSCMNKNRKPVRLDNVNSLRKYLEHLDKHNDALGLALQKRFKAIYDNQFITVDQLDKLAPSPFSLLANVSEPKSETKQFFIKFCIKRDFKVSYICHWKNLFIQNEIIESSSLTFQEDDALMDTFLHYPNPIDDWRFYKTVAFYFLKMYCSNGSASVNLHRGSTNYPKLSRLLSHKELDAQKFFSGINHAGPGLTTLQNWLPTVSYDNEQFHSKYLLCHIRTLVKNDSIALKFEGDVTNFPVICGADDQELNQGTFVEAGVLHGLKKKLSASQIKDIRLVNLPEYIAKENPFVTYAREYRLIDLEGLMCSNVYTSFGAGTLKSGACTDNLRKVTKLANSCEFCLRYSMKCTYEMLDAKCEGCIAKGLPCRRLVVFHVLWDMGSSQVKSAKELPEKLDSSNIALDFLRTDRYTVGFGMLHILKAITNKTRNYVLSLNGENYGIHVLRAMKNKEDKAADMLRNLKNAVFVGKDRQSDYLSYMSSSQVVQDSLQEKKHYILTRSPEPILTHTDAARKQKSLIFPVDVECNRNGDAFVLDAGAACVHVFDRFSITKSYVVGNYNKPNLEQYVLGIGSRNSSLKAKDVRLSNTLRSMTMLNDDLYIADSGRKELAVFTKCYMAKKIRLCALYVCKASNYSSIAACNGVIIALKVDQEQVIQVVTFDFPDKKSDHSLYIKRNILKEITPSHQIHGLFDLRLEDKSFGAVRSDDKKVVFYLEQNKFEEQICEVKTRITPCTTADNHIVILPPNIEKIIQHSVDIDSNSVVSCTPLGMFNDDHCVPSSVVSWGSTLLIVGKDMYSYKIQECGSLNFGLRLTRALNLAYHAIAYLPPHGIKDIAERSFVECIKECKVLADLLNEMQTEMKETFTTRSCFGGAEGNVYTQTVKCLNDTIENWELLVQRLESLDPLLVSKIRPRAVVNESVIEHSFGFINIKAKKQLQDMYEYIHNKSKHELDFQMRLTELPFNQYTKVKLRDKSYQHLDSSVYSKMDMDDFWDIFCDSPKTKEKENEAVEPTPPEATILRQAYLLTKSVPRRSNRSKWKEQSGYRPSLLAQQQEDSHLFPGDIVLSRVLNKSFILMVTKKLVLLNEDSVIEVKILNDTFDGVFTIRNLFHQHGLIFVVPSTLYEAADDFEDMHFSEVISQSLESALLEMESEDGLLSEEDISLIPDITQDENTIETHNVTTSSRKRKAPSSDNDQSDGENVDMEEKAVDDDDDDDIDDDDDDDDEDDDDDMPIIPTDKSFYIVALVTENGANTKHFVAQYDTTRNVSDLYWMNFMRKGEVPNQFSWSYSDGLVSSTELVKALSDPTSSLASSSRRGKLIFNLEEIHPYIETLQ